MNQLPDTNVLINYFEGKEPDKSLVIDLITEDKLAILPITIAELRPGNSKEEAGQLDALIASGTVFPVNTEIGLQAGIYRQEFSRKTKKVYVIDCLVAATCKLHNLTLVTNNTKDYPMKDIKILKPS